MAKYKTKGLIAKIAVTVTPTTPIVQLGDSSFELGERDGLINATTHDTTTGTHAFLDTGFKSPASFSGEILYDPADAIHEILRAAHAAGTTLYLVVVLPDSGSAEFAFPCRCRNLSMPLPVTGKLVINVDLEGLEGTTFTV